MTRCFFLSAAVFCQTSKLQASFASLVARASVRSWAALRCKRPAPKLANSSCLASEPVTSVLRLSPGLLVFGRAESDQTITTHSQMQPVLRNAIYLRQPRPLFP
mmetsp:Transcript_20377/g.40055  ORF Transcript_20377/g.40055 Transcript_20377/m.40055 type:complete len:104 (+) Transcript_20377:1923-2234(+)